MNNKRSNNKRMLKELAALRRRVSELEKEKQLQAEIEQEKTDASQAAD